MHKSVYKAIDRGHQPTHTDVPQRVHNSWHVLHHSDPLDTNQKTTKVLQMDNNAKWPPLPSQSRQSSTHNLSKSRNFLDNFLQKRHMSRGLIGQVVVKREAINIHNENSFGSLYIYILLLNVFIRVCNLNDLLYVAFETRK